jgi:hypothetical protein
MIWANTRKKLPDWEDSSDYDDWGNRVKDNRLEKLNKSVELAVQSDEII